MPDITMCSSKGCPKFGICVRAQSLPDKWAQSYSCFPFDSMGCNYFMPVERNGKTVVFEADFDGEFEGDEE